MTRHLSSLNTYTVSAELCVIAMTVRNIWGWGATPKDLGDSPYDRGGLQCLWAKSQIHFSAWKMQHVFEILS